MISATSPLDMEVAIGPCPIHGLPKAVKRTLDVVVASLVLFATSPILALVMIAVRLDSKGPVIYRARRIGQSGRPIVAYKFRSMYRESDTGVHLQYVRQLLVADHHEVAATGHLFKLQRDARVTRVGGFLRRTSLDELPQLFNVLRGDMSLVGPRPEIPELLVAYESWMYRRFAVQPGMTGLWQTSGRGSLPPREMLRLDAEYVERWNLRTDLRILAVTPFHLRGGVTA